MTVESGGLGKKERGVFFEFYFIMSSSITG
jgi:hypothetical protein